MRREALEVEAKRESDRIDDQIKTEKRTNLLKKEPVKVLMLGQAESGASPLLLYFYSRAHSIVFSLITGIQASRRR
jgi:guanine nucleotide-binding protein subunit alpha